MKRLSSFLLTFLLLAAGLSCKTDDGALRGAVAGKTFVWEKEGFGSPFTIALNEDGSYQYYEGVLSSYIGLGAWRIENGVLILTESGGYDFVFRFAIRDGALVYRAEGSSKFIYADVQDGDRFLPMRQTEPGGTA